MKRGITCIACAPVGDRVAAGGEDGRVIVWALDCQSPTLELPATPGPVNAVAFLRGGVKLLAGGRDGLVRLWDAATGESLGQIRGKVGEIRALAVAGNRVALAGDGLQVRHPDGTFTALHGHRGLVMCLTFSPGGKHLLSGGADGTVRLWRLDEYREVESFPAHDGKVTGVAFAPDGASIYSTGDDGRILRCRVRTPGTEPRK
jgi:WD40 repeat protein